MFFDCTKLQGIKNDLKPEYFGVCNCFGTFFIFLFEFLDCFFEIKS